MTKSEAGKLGYLKSKEKLEKSRQQELDSRKAIYYKNPTHCCLCNKIISYERKIKGGKFCNHSCSAKYSNTRRRKLKKDKNICLNCGKSTSNAKFCSIVCSKEFTIKKKELDIINITSTTIINGNIGPRSIKQYLMKTQGRRCRICGITHWLDKPIMLIMDHINGNSSDNSLQNLRLVCSNCDSTLPTYKNRNVGNGRYNRRIRYSQGKSH